MTEGANSNTTTAPWRGEERGGEAAIIVKSSHSLYISFSNRKKGGEGSRERKFDTALLSWPQIKYTLLLLPLLASFAQSESHQPFYGKQFFGRLNFLAF